MGLFANFESLLLIITAIAFVMEFADAAFGMGFGTGLVSILLLIGFNVQDIVPSLLISQLIGGIVVSIFHVIFKNLKLGNSEHFAYGMTQIKRRKYKILLSHTRLKLNEPEKLNDENNYLEGEPIKEAVANDSTAEEELSEAVEDAKNGSLKKRRALLPNKIKRMSADARIIIILSTIALLSTIVAAVISTIFNYSIDFVFAVNLYISIMIIAMGIITIAFSERKMRLSWKRIIGLGVVAGFNKGLSGGGFGPLIVTGQMISGRNGKQAIATTLVIETIATIAGIVAYVVTNVLVSLDSPEAFSWGYLRLAPYIILGVILSAPIAAYCTKKVDDRKLKKISGTIMIVLGSLVIIRSILLRLGIWTSIPGFTS